MGHADICQYETELLLALVKSSLKSQVLRSAAIYKDSRMEPGNCDRETETQDFLTVECMRYMRHMCSTQAQFPMQASCIMHFLLAVTVPHMNSVVKNGSLVA